MAILMTREEKRTMQVHTSREDILCCLANYSVQIQSPCILLPKVNLYCLEAGSCCHPVRSAWQRRHSEITKRYAAVLREYACSGKWIEAMSSQTKRLCGRQGRP